MKTQKLHMQDAVVPVAIIHVLGAVIAAGQVPVQQIVHQIVLQVV